MHHPMHLATPLCPECGYELVGLHEDPPGTVRCPECSAACDLASAPRISPWPGLASLARRLCGPLVLNVAAALLVVVVMYLAGVPSVEWVRRVVALLFLTLVVALPVTGIVMPAMGAMMLAQRHTPRPRQTATFVRVLGGALAVNGAVVLGGVFVADLMDAW